MILNPYLALLALAPAVTPDGTKPNPTGEFLRMLGMLGAMGFVLYFVVLRPQRTRQKHLDTLLKNLKAGDRIVTASGIIGVIVSVKDKTLSIRSGETKLEILKTAVSERMAEKAADATES